MSNNALANRLNQRKQALEQGKESIQINPIQINELQCRTLTLSSGKLIKLRLQTFTGKDEIEHKTCIDSSNIREQSWLNTQSLSDILPTIATIQLYPAIGYYSKGSILIVDGSRRRAAAIISNCSFIVEVSDQPLSKQEAKEIVDISDKKKKFTDFEWGKFYTTKMDKSELSQKDFSKLEGISESTMSRYINAYRVDDMLYSLFIDRATINSVADSQRLIKIFKSINSTEHCVDEFVVDVHDLIEEKVDQCESIDEHKGLVFDCLESMLKKVQSSKVGRKKKNLEPISLFNGSKNNEFIRYQDDSPHKSTIVLSRISVEKRDKIKEYIQKVMDNDLI